MRCWWPFFIYALQRQNTEISNKYSQKRNIRVSVPISTFMPLWVIYIFPRLVCLFCWRKYVDRSWEYINRSQTHKCGNWGWCRAIPRKGIHKWDFRCSVTYRRSCRFCNFPYFKSQNFLEVEKIKRPQTSRRIITVTSSLNEIYTVSWETGLGWGGGVIPPTTTPF